MSAPMPSTRQTARARRHHGRALLALFAAALAAACALTGYGLWQWARQPAGTMRDLAGGYARLDTHVPPGSHRDRALADGSITIPAIGYDLPVRFYTSPAPEVNPLDYTNVWLDETLSPHWQDYAHRIILGAHSITGGIGTGNELQGQGPGIHGVPKTGMALTLNGHDYTITSVYEVAKKHFSTDPRFQKAKGIVLVTCKIVAGTELSTDNIVILADRAT